MATISMQVEGGDELVRKLKAIGADVNGELEVAALAGAEVIRQAADRGAPSAANAVEVLERGNGYVIVGIGPDKEHWFYRFFETGAGPHGITGEPLVFEGREDTVVTWSVDHPGMAARPFLRPAFDGEKQRATKEVGDVLKGVLT